MTLAFGAGAGGERANFGPSAAHVAFGERKSGQNSAGLGHLLAVLGCL